MKKITRITLPVMVVLVSLALFAQAANKPTRLLPGGNANPPAAAPLAITCEPCAVPEGEPYIPTNGQDVTNGGCFITPSLFSPISLGQIYCGNINTYSSGSNYYTDLDWYELTLAAPSPVYFSVYTDISTQIWIIGNDCNSLPTYAYAYPAGPGVNTISANLAAGTYWLVLGSYNWLGEGGGTNYMATVTAAPPGAPATWCTPTVPTLTEWGLIIMGMALLGFGTFYILRMRGNAA